MDREHQQNVIQCLNMTEENAKYVANISLSEFRKGCVYLEAQEDLQL